MYQIDTDIPLPARTNPNAGATPSVYPLADMLVGDSFFVPCDSVTIADRRRVSAATAGFTRRRKDSGIKFSIRTVDGGLRVWRVA
jgi:hypothetical protein